MLIKLTSLFILSTLSGLLYRAGGIGKPFNTKWRDLGCSLIFILYMLYFYPIYNIKVVISYFFTFLLMFGALTTYWDKIFKEDNFFFHGFMVGLACFPLFWIGVYWWAILLRAIILAILMGGWCKIFKNDIVEEMGRGGFIVLTLPILLF